MNIYVLLLHPSLYYSRNLVVCALEIHISVSNTSSQILPVTRTILHCVILGQGLGTRNFFPLDFNFSSFLSSFIMVMRLDGLFSFSTQVILWRVRTLKQPTNDLLKLQAI